MVFKTSLLDLFLIEGTVWS